ncbi:MAG: MaoC family dehydratase [Bacteroidota bacterium]
MKKQFKTGDKVSVSKAFSKEEVLAYLKISTDTNPIHYDEEFASSTTFKKCIVPGMLVSSLFGGMLGSELPGNGTILLSQSSDFRKPVFVGEEVTAEIEIIKIREDKPIITFKTICKKNNDDIAIDGEAVVKFESYISVTQKNRV